MPIDVACDRCERQYAFADAQAGLHFKCQVCGKLLRVPLPVVPLEEPDFEAAGEYEERQEYEVHGPPPLPAASMVAAPESMESMVPLPPLPPPVLVHPAAAQWRSDFAGVESARVAPGEFWKGMIVPLAAVAVFILATGVYGIFARSVSARQVARATPKQAPQRRAVAPAPRPAPAPASRAGPRIVGRRPAPPLGRPTNPMTRPYSPPVIQAPRQIPAPSVALGASGDVDVSRLPSWQVRADGEDLGEPVTVGEYSIRPPRDWAVGGNRRENSRSWVGRAAGPPPTVSPRLSVTIRPRSDRIRREVPAVITRPEQQAIPPGASVVIYAPRGTVEYGKVNGIAVAKVTFADTGATRRHVQYGAFEGENYVLVDAWFDAADERAARAVDESVRTLGRGN